MECSVGLCVEITQQFNTINTHYSQHEDDKRHIWLQWKKLSGNKSWKTLEFVVSKFWQQQGEREKKRQTEGKADTLYQSNKKKKNCIQSEIATQLITIVICKQNYNRLWTCTQKTTRAQKTTTSHQPMLISTHPGFLSLAFIHSVSLKHTNINIETHTRMHAHTHSMHTSLSFIPKYMKANLSHPLPAILSLQLSEALFPLLSQRCLLNLPVFLANNFPSLHTWHPFFSLASSQSGGAFFVSSFEIICVNWENPWGRVILFFSY